MYNKTYMEALALSALEAEADALAGEEAMQELDENGEPLVPDGEGNNPEPETFTADEAQLQERIEAMIPATIDDILTFANSYDAPEQVEAVFKWDVADIFL